MPVSAKKAGKAKGKTSSVRLKSKPALDEGAKVSNKACSCMAKPPAVPFLSQGQEGTASYGLWECYSDQATSVQEEGHDGALKNIRGFLLKKRKSPLKGWRKVSYKLREI